jgi:hypothetical protein
MISKDIDTSYFRSYRHLLGFSNQGDAKTFLGAKDVLPRVDLDYIEKLNLRLIEIIQKIDLIVSKEIKIDNISDFQKNYIDDALEIMKTNDILPRLNNQGRRPEEVYYSWMRGYLITNYFMSAISIMFGSDLKDIKTVGDDDLKQIDTFRRTPTADLEVELVEFGRIRLEVQAGFQGVNDIKQHKVMEAKRMRHDSDLATLVIHFDIYNGQVGIIRIDDIQDDNVNWITRQQMEGQTVFNIEQNYFIWKLTEDCPNPSDITKIIHAIEL